MCMPTETFSLAILTYKNDSQLQDCLSSTLSSENLQHMHEILVIDNNASSRSAAEWLLWRDSRGFPAGVEKIRFLKNTKNNLGLARALAVTNCASELIAFVDSDCVLPKKWAESLWLVYFKEQKNRQNLAGVCGPNRPPSEGSWNVAISLAQESFLGHGFSAQAWRPQRAVEVSHLPTTNALFLKSAILQVGNFSSLQDSVGEDLELGIRLLENGYQMILSPTPAVTNGDYRSLSEWCNRMIRFGKVNAQLCHANKKINVAVLMSLSLLMAFFCLAILVILSARHSIFIISLTLIAALYIAANFFEALRVSHQQKKIALTPKVFFVLIATHISYGVGALRACLAGALKLIESRRKEVSAETSV